MERINIGELLGLTVRETKILFEQCAGHPVAECRRCGEYELDELVAAVLEDGTVDGERPGSLCPRCGADLASEVIRHVEECENFEEV